MADALPPRSSSSTATTAHNEGALRKPQRFSHKFFDPEVAHLRQGFIKAMVGTLVLTIIVMWLCLPVYWGSLAHQRSYTDKLKAYFIDNDGSEVGSAIKAAIEANQQLKTKAKLGWVIQTSMTAEQAQKDVIDEKAWVAVVVNAGATSALLTARQTGDATYNGTHAISVFYDQGRNELATNSYVVPYTQAILQQTIANFSAHSAAQWLTANSGNQTALQTIIRAPQTLSTPLNFAMLNLRPYSAPVATAIILVGNIYIIIFSFIFTAAGFGARAPLEPFLTTKQLIAVRFAFPFMLYLPLSLSYAMINLAFKVPFDAKFSYAGGFFTYWMFVYITMLSLGLATEFAVTWLTMRFMTFFLLPLIIINVSVTSLPIALEPWFYHYGFGFPIYNMAQATRTLIFNTKSHLGTNAGVLIAWIVLSSITLPLSIMFMRRGARKETDAVAAAEAKEREDVGSEKGGERA